MTIMPAFNVYDIRKKCEKPPLCYDFSLLDKLMARADVRKELGVFILEKIMLLSPFFNLQRM